MQTGQITCRSGFKGNHLKLGAYATSNDEPREWVISKIECPFCNTLLVKLQNRTSFLIHRVIQECKITPCMATVVTIANHVTVLKCPDCVQIFTSLEST